MLLLHVALATDRKRNALPLARPKIVSCKRMRDSPNPLAPRTAFAFPGKRVACESSSGCLTRLRLLFSREKHNRTLTTEDSKKKKQKNRSANSEWPLVHKGNKLTTVEPILSSAQHFIMRYCSCSPFPCPLRSMSSNDPELVVKPV